MDTFVQVAFSDQLHFRGFRDIDASKLTYRKYLEYGRSCDGPMQFYADLTGETLNPDSRLDRETAYNVWMGLTSDLVWTRSNLGALPRWPHPCIARTVSQSSRATLRIGAGE